MKKGFLLLSLLIVIAITGFAIRPTVQSSNITYNNVNCGSLKLNWSTGDGAMRVIVAKEGTLPDYTPQDGEVFSANPAFGGSSVYPNNCYIVYNGTGNNFVTVTNLQKGKTYYFTIYEHDNQNNQTKYLIANAPSISATTFDVNLDFTVRVIDSCEATNRFEFTNNSTSTVPGIKYYFDFGNNDSSSQSPVIKKIAGNGFKAVYIKTITSATDCPVSFVRNVKIFPKKVAYVDKSLYVDSQCLETNYYEIQISPIVLPIQIGFTYRWWLGDGDSFTFPKLKKRYKKSGVFNVELELTSNSYSKPTACKDTIRFTLTVLPSPVGNIEVKDTYQCLRTNGFTFNNPDSSLSYFKWYFGDNDSSSSKLASHRYRDTGTYKVMHVAYAKSGCKGRDTIDIEVLPDLVSQFIGLDTFYCQSKVADILTPYDPNGTYSGYPMKGDSLVPDQLGSHVLTYIVKDQYCADTTKASFRVAATPTPYIGNDTAICSALSYDLSANTTGDVYYWSTGENTRDITVTSGGTYDVTVTTGKCSASDTMQIIFSSIPKINIGRDTILCKGGGTWLRANYPKSSYLWSNGSTDSSIYAYNPGKYKVTVSNPCGTAQDSINIFFQTDYCDLFMANAFTPGNDLVNNVFMPRGRNITVKLFQIYNRWGELVFQTDQDNVGWDGTYKGEPVQEGLYIWKLWYSTENGPYIKKSNAFGQVILIK